MPRAEKKFHFIYKTTNLLSGKYYIGMHSTDNLEDGYLGSGKRLKYSLNKYGKENHVREILEFCDSRIELALIEKKLVDKSVISNNFYLNMTIGGFGGPTRTGHKHSEESKEKIRSSLKGKVLSDKTKLKISISGKGKHNFIMTEDQKNKLSLVKKGVPSKLKGIPRSQETKDKISRSNSNKPFKKRVPLSKATKVKISEGNKLKHNFKVIQMTLNNVVIKIWDSITEASLSTKAHHISHVCKGKRQSSGGFKWKYAT